MNQEAAAAAPGYEEPRLLYPAAAAENSLDLSAAARSNGLWAAGVDMKVWWRGLNGSRPEVGK